jgi:hypothetical protein
VANKVFTDLFAIKQIAPIGDDICQQPNWRMRVMHEHQLYEFKCSFSSVFSVHRAIFVN